jgi:predicted metal-binding transcription factor (methanogenesis marker protein 9)
MTLAQYKYLIKLTVGWLPVGKRLAMYGDKTCNCHCCDQLKTCDHIMQCPKLEDGNVRLVQEPATFLRKEKTVEEVTTALCEGLLVWLLATTKGKKRNRMTIPTITQVAYKEQTAIRWGRLCC